MRVPVSRLNVAIVVARSSQVDVNALVKATDSTFSARTLPCSPARSLGALFRGR
jgi:hypothetical protein